MSLLKAPPREHDDLTINAASVQEAHDDPNMLVARAELALTGCCVQDDVSGNCRFRRLGLLLPRVCDERERRDHTGDGNRGGRDQSCVSHAAGDAAAAVPPAPRRTPVPAASPAPRARPPHLATRDQSDTDVLLKQDSKRFARPMQAHLHGGRRAAGQTSHLAHRHVRLVGQRKRPGAGSQTATEAPQSTRATGHSLPDPPQPCRNQPQTGAHGVARRPRSENRCGTTTRAARGRGGDSQAAGRKPRPSPPRPDRHGRRPPPTACATTRRRGS